MGRRFRARTLSLQFRLTRVLRSLAWIPVAILLSTLFLGPLPVQAHPKQVQVIGSYEVTYFSDPQDPVANSQTALFIQVRTATTGVQLRVFHFLMEMIPPSGPRFLGGHPLSDSTLFTFNQPGNWIVLFGIGLTSNLGVYDITANFVADVSQAPTSSLLGSFGNVLLVAVPKAYVRWGHIVAVVLWLGTVLHVVNTYRVSSGNQAGLANFARTFRRVDLVVAVAVGLLILTGILRAFAHGLTTVPSLFASDFGLVLFAKISLAGGMIGIGIFNRTYLLRRLEWEVGQADPVSAGKKTSVLARRIYYLTILEMGLGVSAILFGTVFTQIHTIP